MRSTADMATHFSLTQLEVDYWYEVDNNWGRGAAEFYTAEGRFHIGDKVMSGPAEIRDFYRWREGRGARVARHVVSNFRVIESGAGARLDCLLCLYAADGAPVLESRPAIMIADIVGDCVRDGRGVWRFTAHRLIPLFMGGEPPTIPGATPV